MSGLLGLDVSGRMSLSRLLILFVFTAGALLPLTACGVSGTGDSGADTYPEQDVRFLVGVSAGGGFDAIARTLAPYLKENLPGDGKVVVENLTGAGGLRAANTLYTAEPDGYTIGITNTIGLAASQASGQADFELNEFTWIGRLLADPEVLMVAGDSEFQSMEDLQSADRELRAAVTSLSAGSGVGAILIGDAYGFDWTPVTHEGLTEAKLSVVRGDTEFVVSNIQSILPEAEAGELRPLLSVRESDQLPNVPVAGDEGHEELGTALSVAFDIAAPPDLPPETRDALAQAFTESVNDPGFQAEIEEVGYPPDPLNAQETGEEVADTLQIYQGYEELLVEAFSNN